MLTFVGVVRVALAGVAEAARMTVEAEGGLCGQSFWSKINSVAGKYAEGRDELVKGNFAGSKCKTQICLKSIIFLFKRFKAKFVKLVEVSRNANLIKD